MRPRDTTRSCWRSGSRTRPRARRSRRPRCEPPAPGDRTMTSSTRRQFLAGAAATAAVATAPVSVRTARAATDFQLGMFYAIAGPAAGLFGPTQKACAELAVEEVNARGGILGRKVQLVFANGDAAVADATKAAVRMMLEDKVDFFLGSHNSAVREAL